MTESRHFHPQAAQQWPAKCILKEQFRRNHNLLFPGEFVMLNWSCKSSNKFEFGTLEELKSKEYSVETMRVFGKRLITNYSG